MRTRSCATTRPAPRLRWPTSELPICPSGSPTARPAALSVVCGQRAQSASKTGVRASSHGVARPRGRAAEAVEHDERRRCGHQPASAARAIAAKLARIEARTAHERAVDVGLRQQGGGVVGLDRAAVEDAHGSRRTPRRSAQTAAPRMNACASCAISGVAVFARADRPDGLVGDRDLQHVRRVDAGEAAVELGAETRLGRAAVALGLASRRRTAPARARPRAPRRACARSASSVSPKSWRRSEWPSSTPVAPASISMAPRSRP